MTLRVRFAMSLAISALAVPAFAQSTIFTSSAAFLANVQPGYYTEGFEGSAGSGSASISFTGGSAPFSYIVTSIGGSNAVYRNGLIGSVSSNASVTISFTGGKPTAIGGNFFVTDVNDNFLALPVTVNLSDGTSVSYTPTSAGDYRGFISTVSISSLTMAAPTNGSFNVLDNLTVGLAANAPEPGSLALLALGGIGGAAILRRRTK